MDTIRLPASYYQQFDADYSLPVPGEAFGGWQKAEIEISAAHTALVVMHAWNCGTFEEFPGVWRSVEYVPRSYEIARTVFPPVLAAARASRLPVFHVVGGGDYYKDLPGYKHAVEIAGPPPPTVEPIPGDPVLDALRQFKADKVWRGAHNNPDGARLAEKLDFLPEARPVGDEGVAENGEQLAALCREKGINHLIYTGFAIDACLLSSPGGMLDMSRYGVMCSAVRQGVTAVENKETARQQLAKEIGLWRVAISFGFVFDDTDLIAALKTVPR
ncbi:MAG: hypothetical protein HPY69_14685 [Armatimonadetes bacterium]|nr:hypothetical protein [Armatimonadota bacterium]